MCNMSANSQLLHITSEMCCVAMFVTLK